MAISQDYQAEVRTLTIGAGTDIRFGRAGLRGFGSPPGRKSTMPRGGGHGSVHGTPYYDERLLALPLWMRGSTPAAANQNYNTLKSVWRPSFLEEAEDELKVRFPGMASSDSIYRYYGRYMELEGELEFIAMKYVTTLAMFLATDPLAYGPELSTAVDSSSPLPITNNGHLPTERFSIQIIGNGGTPLVTSTTDDSSSVGFAGPLGAAAVAVLDFKDKDLAVGGIPAFDQLSPGPRWFRLLPGANSITFSGCASIQVTYQEAFT